MGEIPLKKASINVRVRGDMRPELEAIAREMRIEISQLVRAIAEEYVAQYKLHDGNLPWPPKFQYYADGPTNATNKKKGE